MSDINLLVYEALQSEPRKQSTHPYHEIFRDTMKRHGVGFFNHFATPQHRINFFDEVKRRYAEHKLKNAK